MIADRRISTAEDAEVEARRIREVLQLLVDLLFEALEGRTQITAEEQRLLDSLAEGSLPHFVSWLGRLRKPALRRAVSEAILATGERCRPELWRQSSALNATPDPGYVRELFHILLHLRPEGSLPFVERLLEAEIPEVRREATLALRRLSGECVESRWLELLEDEDAQIRIWAVTALAGGGNRKLAGKMLERVMSTEKVARGLEETTRCFSAVARLGGLPTLFWFGQLLQPSKRHWFLRRRDLELVWAVAHALRVLATVQAEALLMRITQFAHRSAGNAEEVRTTLE